MTAAVPWRQRVAEYVREHLDEWRCMSSEERRLFRRRSYMREYARKRYRRMSPEARRATEVKRAQRKREARALERAAHPTSCASCHVQFVQRTKSQVYCSRKCKERAAMARYWAKREAGAIRRVA